jgi:signal transduction histidine kinase/DNA-binding response OmpR family regulator
MSMRRRFASLSIRSKIIGTIVVTAVLVLVGGFAVVMANDVRIYRQQLVTNAVLLARVTGNSCVSELAFGDRKEAADTLRRLTAGESVHAAYIFDAAGATFANFHKDKEPSTLPHLVPGERRFIGDQLYVSEPIIYEGERYGSIVLVMPTGALRSAIQSYAWTIVAIVGVLMLVSLLFAVMLERVISGPLLELSAAAHDISERHDYTVRVQRRSSDEIGLLSDAFNEMLSEIERRQRERDEADRRTREKSRFLANMSHELRTPLNAIIGFSEILHDRLNTRMSDRERLFLENITTSGQHLLGLVNDILDLSKVEAGLMELKVEPFPVEPSVAGVCALMKGVSSRHQVEIEIDIQPTLPPLEGDAVKIKQVLYNLISNAVKFSPAKEVVTVRACTVSGEESMVGEPSMRFEVIDHGIGIDPAEHERIFEEFRQVDSPSTTEGTGLGLALVRKLVHLHRGEIRLESALGKGSTFTVDIPLRSDATSAPVELPRGDARPVVLVIEDEIASYRVLEAQLVAAGYLPIHAPTGEEGLRLAHALVPAAITLDLVLPGIDGWEVMRQLKRDINTRRIPVIVVSLTESRTLAFALGADDYIVKPLAHSQLADVMDRIVQRVSDNLDLLVVSNDSMLHEHLARDLAPLGYNLRHAYSADQGFEEAARRPGALTLVDTTGEGLSGFEVALRLKNNPGTAGSAVVLLTSPAAADECAVTVDRPDGESARELVTAVQSLLARRYEQDRSQRSASRGES